MSHPLHERLCLGLYVRLNRVPDFTAVLRELRRTQRLSRSRLRELSETRLQELLLHARRRSPFWGEKLAGFPERQLRSLRLEETHLLPVLEKEELRQRLPEILCRGCGEEAFPYRTGGTTGEFTSICIPRSTMKSRSYAAALRAWEWGGFSPGDRYVRLWGLSADRSRRAGLRGAVNGALMRKRELDAFRMDPREVERYLRLMRRFRPLALVSHPTPLAMLARALLERGQRLESLRCAFTTAETLLPGERRLVEEALGCPLFDYYGNRESNVIAAQCGERDGYHVSVENGLLEVVDGRGRSVGEGERGEVLVTDFYNRVMPLIRYRVGDMAVAGGEGCGCGLELPLVGRFSGRKLEAVRAADGRQVPGELFILLMERHPWVHRLQVVQKQGGGIVLKLALHRGEELTPARARALAEGARGYLGALDVALDVGDGDELLSPSGKHRWVVSEG